MAAEPSNGQSVDPVAADTPADPAAVAQPHDFEVQKALHQQIRNDPDYDDWEYGTEPLPHEAWVARVSEASSGDRASA
jgi:hypothetical protein